MKFSTKLTFWALALLCFGVAQTFAQDDDELSDPLNPTKAPSRLYIGPVAGLNRVFHTSEFQAIPAPFAGETQLTCPTIQGGTATGYFFGITAEYLLGDPKEAQSSIVSRVVFSSWPATFREANQDEYPTRLPNSDEIVWSQTENYSEVKYQTIDLEAMYKLNLFGSRFGVSVGPTAGYVLTFQQRQEYNLLKPTNAQFIPNPEIDRSRYTNNDRTIVIRDGDVPETSPLRLGLKLGAHYEFMLRKLMIVPGLYYNQGILTARSNESWRVNALQPQLDVRYVF